MQYCVVIGAYGECGRSRKLRPDGLESWKRAEERLVFSIGNFSNGHRLQKEIEVDIVFVGSKR